MFWKVVITRKDGSRVTKVRYFEAENREAAATLQRDRFADPSMWEIVSIEEVPEAEYTQYTQGG